MREFRMPSLGADMEAGTLVEWLKTTGDKVERGDIVAVVETQKGAIEIEIFESGVISSTLTQPGEKVPVGAVLATLDGEYHDDHPPLEAPPVVTPAPPSKKKAPVQAPKLTKKKRPRISPAARKRAGELGISIDGLTGTGDNGAITLADIEKFPKAVPAPSSSAEAMRSAIAAAMSRSKREIPHFYLDTTIDMSRAIGWLEQANLERPVSGRILYGVLLMKSVALALNKTPELNGFWIDGRLQPSEAFHIGWAISLRGGGLIAPEIHDADRKSLDELMEAMRDLVKRARAGGLRSSELSDATITVTSLGEQGPESVFGVIHPPQLALIGFGGLVRRPIAVEDAVAVHPAIKVSLSADHRASDGHRGGLLLKRIDQLLQSPEEL